MRLIFLILLFGVATAVSGYNFALETQEPEVKVVKETVELVREVPVEKPTYLIKEVIKEVPVEVPVEVVKEKVVYQQPEYRLFKDIAEFNAWFKGVSLTLLGGDCDDIAEAYVRAAVSQGFLIGYQYVDFDGFINSKKVMIPKGQAHMGLLVMTQDNRIYYVEPANGETIFISLRDLAPLP